MLSSSFLRQHLLPGESLLWSGQPARGLLLVRRHAVLLPITLIWSAAAVQAAIGLDPEDSTYSRILAWILVCVGVYGLVGTLAMDAWVRRNTSYGLTNSRLLIDGPRRGGGFRAFALDELPSPRLIKCWGGQTYVTVRFEEARPWWTQIRLGYSGGNNFRAWQPSLDGCPQLLAIEDSAEVMRHLKERLLTARSAGDSGI